MSSPYVCRILQLLLLVAFFGFSAWFMWEMAHKGYVRCPPGFDVSCIQGTFSRLLRTYGH
jgi:TRAP-type C4-dicarboxylate transport system permease small subunit